MTNPCTDNPNSLPIIHLNTFGGDNGGADAENNVFLRLDISQSPPIKTNYPFGYAGTYVAPGSSPQPPNDANGNPAKLVYPGEWRYGVISPETSVLYQGQESALTSRNNLKKYSAVIQKGKEAYLLVTSYARFTTDSGNPSMGYFPLQIFIQKYDLETGEVILNGFNETPVESIISTMWDADGGDPYTYTNNREFLSIEMCMSYDEEYLFVLSRFYGYSSTLSLNYPRQVVLSKIRASDLVLVASFTDLVYTSQVEYSYISASDRTNLFVASNNYLYFSILTNTTGTSNLEILKLDIDTFSTLTTVYTFNYNASDRYRDIYRPASDYLLSWCQHIITEKGVFIGDDYIYFGTNKNGLSGQPLLARIHDTTNAYSTLDISEGLESIVKGGVSSITYYNDYLYVASCGRYYDSFEGYKTTGNGYFSKIDPVTFTVIEKITLTDSLTQLLKDGIIIDGKIFLFPKYISYDLGEFKIYEIPISSTIGTPIIYTYPVTFDNNFELYGYIWPGQYGPLFGCWDPTTEQGLIFINT